MTTKVNLTSTEAKPLVKYEDGEHPAGYFIYISVVVMLIYFTGHFCPGIAYAVICVSRFIFCTNISHELVLNGFGWYLKATRDIHLVINTVL